MDGSRDPFIDKFFSRIPREVAASFTVEQLGAVKMAFGARSWGSHAIDVRKSFPLFWHRIYIVLLMGRERRDDERLRAEGAMFGTLGNAVVGVVFLAIILTPVAFALYLLKSSLGLDVMPGGDGMHGFWSNLARQIELALR
jgi:hypothetical protein